MSKVKLKDLLSEAFENTPRVDKRQTIEGVRNFGIVGKTLYNSSNIMEVAKQLSSIAESAHNHILGEQDDWFDKISVNKNMKTLKGVAMQLANRYLQDMKKIQQDPEYKDEVRKSPEDVKAFKNIKGKDIEKGKLTKQYKRKYKDESSQFEAWLDTKVAEMEIALESDEIVKSEYQDPYTV